MARRALDGARVSVRRAFDGVMLSIGSERVLLSRSEAIAFAREVAEATVPADVAEPCRDSRCVLPPAHTGLCIDADGVEPDPRLSPNRRQKPPR